MVDDVTTNWQTAD